MSQNRVFFPQEALDLWIEEGRISLVGDELTATAEGRTFHLQSAVRFMSEVTTGEDPNALIGKVKTIAQVESLSGEHDRGSVIIGDHAYEVIDGYLGALIGAGPRPERRSRGDAPSDALGLILHGGRAS